MGRIRVFRVKTGECHDNEKDKNPSMRKDKGEKGWHRSTGWWKTGEKKAGIGPRKWSPNARGLESCSYEQGGAKHKKAWSKKKFNKKRMEQFVHNSGGGFCSPAKTDGPEDIGQRLWREFQRRGREDLF